MPAEKSTMFIVRTPSVLTEEALKRIGELYAIESEIRGKEQRNGRQSGTKSAAAAGVTGGGGCGRKTENPLKHSELAKAFGMR